MESAPRQELDAFAEWHERKRLGAFYTPSALSDILCDWAITESSDVVLEPSFGGCGFLESGVSRLKELGAREPNQQLYGCDIDARAFEHLSQRFGKLIDLENFKKENFLTFAHPASWPSEFDAIVGNPPYLSYHHISAAEQEIAQQRLTDIGFDIPRKSSTWAYFVGLSLQFLKSSGRVAWVLPGSFLQTNYASPLRSFLSSRFDKIHAFQIRERLFLYEGTDEQTVVLLAEGYNAGNVSVAEKDISMSVCEHVADLPEAISSWSDSTGISYDSCGTAVANSLDPAAKTYFDLLSEKKFCHELGDLARVQIGLVTGANSFFLLSPSAADNARLEKSDLTHTLGKFIDAPGLRFSKSDLRSIEARDRRCLLVSSETDPSTKERVREYLSTFPKNDKDSNSTFKKRSVWSKTDDGNIPDAFFPVMHHLGPRVVLNHAKINCTNTLHRLYFRERLSAPERKLVAISMLTTFSQLSAELVGRKYGSGVLKHEPREAERIRLLSSKNRNSKSVNQAYGKIDRLLRSGHINEARALADEFILRPSLKNEYEIIRKILDTALLATREFRHPGDRTKARIPRN